MLQIKCPSCSRIMDFDSENGTLHCKNCSTSILITDIDMPEYGSYKNSTYINELARENIAEGNKDDAIFQEKDNRTEEDINNKFSDIYDISGYIPFEMSSEEAINCIRMWSGRKMFTPGSFNSSLSSGNIDMCYYPVFLFDISACGTLHSVCTRNNDNTSEHIMRTHYYDVYRQADIKNSKTFISASDSLSDTVLENLLPYDADKITEYTKELPNTAILQDITKKSSILYKTAKDRIFKKVRNTLFKTLDIYSSSHNSDISVRTYDMNISAILVPVWRLNYMKNGITRRIYINGTNKNIYGDRPLSLPKTILWTVLSGLVIFAISMLIWRSL